MSTLDIVTTARAVGVVLHPGNYNGSSCPYCHGYDSIPPEFLCTHGDAKRAAKAEELLREARKNGFR